MFCWTIDLHLNGGPKGCSYAAVSVKHKVYTFEELYYGNNAFGELCYGNTAQTDVHVVNTVSFSWSKLTLVRGLGKCHLKVPRTREDHTAVLIEDTIYIWGGFPYHNVLYAFDIDTHIMFKPQVSGTVPEARWSHSACVLEKVMFIYGGWTQLTKYSIDIYKLDTTTMVWSLINTRGTPPLATYRHSATIVGTKMFLIGGRGDYGVYCNNMRVFDTETNCWLNTQPLPDERNSYSSFPYNGELCIHGDYIYIWRFNPETVSWKKVETKGKDPWAYRVFRCIVGDRIILFGRQRNKTNNLYILDLNPSLKTLCKLAVMRYGLEQWELPHNIRWELTAMTTNSN